MEVLLNFFCAITSSPAVSKDEAAVLEVGGEKRWDEIAG